MVEVGHFLSEDEILEESWASLPSSETILVANLTTNIIGEIAIAIVDYGI